MSTRILASSTVGDLLSRNDALGRSPLALTLLENRMMQAMQDDDLHSAGILQAELEERKAAQKREEDAMLALLRERNREMEATAPKERDESSLARSANRLKSGAHLGRPGASDC